VLPEFLPRLVAVKDVDAYHPELLALISRLNDGDANLWGSLKDRPSSLGRASARETPTPDPAQWGQINCS